MAFCDANRSIVVLAVCLAAIVLLQPVTAQEMDGDGRSGSNLITSVPRTMSYQGILKDAAGQSVTDTLDITFRIYDVELGGAALWMEAVADISIIDGSFTAILGETIPINLSFDVDYWMSLQVEGDALEMAPRLKFHMSSYAARSDTSEYALNSDFLDGLDSGDFAGAVHDHDAEYVNEGQADAISSAMILDGSIQFDDIGENGAAYGQVMKWDGTSWVAAIDEVGAGGGGWINDGNTVRLETSTDTVGIGTNSPSEKLHVAGNLLVTGKGIIGTGHTNTGYYAFVAGTNNTVSGDYSAVGGGGSNTAAGARSTIGGGASNAANGDDAVVGGGWGNIAAGENSVVAGGVINTANAYSGVISGGYQNSADSNYSVVGGGRNNSVAGHFSVIPGGYADTITSSYSFLFGIDSKLTQDSTFMVDMPHIRFGDEAVGYEFPVFDGAVNQVIITDGSGQLSWADMSGGGAGWIDNGTVVRLATITDSVGIGTTTPTEKLDVSGNIHASGTISSGSSIVIDGSFDQITASGGTIDFNDENLITTGKAAIGPEHINTGANTFVAGSSNTVSGGYSSVAGGQSNIAGGSWACVGGGQGNEAVNAATVIGGGVGNYAAGYISAIGGGNNNTAFGEYASIGGGYSNQASGFGSTICGGRFNDSGDSCSTVAGGLENYATEPFSAIGGGRHNHARDRMSVIAGGYFNETDGDGAAIGGGYYNEAAGYCSTVPGGRYCSAAGQSSFAAGNIAKANHSGSIVISADNTGLSTDSVSSGGNEQMVLRADGGIYLTEMAEVAPYDNTNIITTRGGAYLSNFGHVWTNHSDRESKENFTPVNGAEIMDKIAILPVTQWNYKADDINEKHIGPTAQDFFEVFGLGGDDKSISTIDPAGIALTGIKELIQENRELRDLIVQLERRITELENK